MLSNSMKKVVTMWPLVEDERLHTALINSVPSKDLLLKAYSFAKERHKNQKDKSGVSYMKHLLTVSRFEKTYTSEKATPIDYLVSIIGLLHDVLEDTPTTYDELVEMFGEGVASYVHDLTRTDNDYDSYITHIAGDVVLLEIKLRDLRNNSDFSRLKVITKKDVERQEKYFNKICYLLRADAPDS